MGNSLESLQSTVKSTLSTMDCCDEDLTGLKLKHLHVICRHGTRTPLHNPPIEEVEMSKDVLMAAVPKTDISIKVCSLSGGERPVSDIEESFKKIVFKGGLHAGMLTSRGREDTYQLGQRIRANYIVKHKLVSEEYDPREVTVRSTNVNRCIESLQCVLAGMYGKAAFENKEPVRISVSDIDSEILFPVMYCCPQLLQLVYANEERLKSSDSYSETLTKVKKYLTETHFAIVDVYDIIVVRKSLDLPIPEDVLKYSREIEEAAVQTIKYCMAGYEDNRSKVAPLAIGQFIEMILKNLSAATVYDVKSVDRPKIQIYTCHDNSLVPLLVLMGCYDEKWPPFAADLLIELYENPSGQHWIRVLYCDKPMIMRGAKKPLISLEQFVNLLSPYSMTAAQYAECCGNETALKSFAQYVDEALQNSNQ